MMKKDRLLPALFILLTLIFAQGARGQGARDEQPRYRMELVRVQDSDDQRPEYLFVVGKVAFRTLYEFKDFIARMPAGAVLEWSPGCLRRGDEPLLNSPEELEDFKRYCAEHGVEFILYPSG